MEARFSYRMVRWIQQKFYCWQCCIATSNNYSTKKKESENNRNLTNSTIHSFFRRNSFKRRFLVYFLWASMSIDSVHTLMENWRTHYTHGFCFMLFSTFCLKHFSRSFSQPFREKFEILSFTCKPRAELQKFFFP